MTVETARAMLGNMIYNLDQQQHPLDREMILAGLRHVLDALPDAADAVAPAAPHAEADDWQPIETAPDDGRPVWICPHWPNALGKENSVGLVEADGEYWRWLQRTAPRRAPTHWRPAIVPAPPADTQASEGERHAD